MTSRPPAAGPLQGHVLALDASCPQSAVVVGRLDPATPAGGVLLASDVRVDGANQASQTLDGRIRDVLERAGLELSDLAGLACGRGPGTFTGTRVAVATMQGLSLGAGLDVLGIGTLEALAHDEQLPADGRPRLALLDARRGEVYAQLFTTAEDGAMRALEDPVCAPLDSVLRRFADSGGHPSALRAIGPGVEAYADALPKDAVPVAGPSAQGLWSAVTEAARTRVPERAEALSALYLRATYAELGLNKPKRPVFRHPALDAD